MKKAVPIGVGDMAGLIGVELEAAQALAGASAEDEVCDVANDNGGGQIVLSGHAGAIDRALALAPEHGIRRAVKLTVSAPFQCALIAPAADARAEALAPADPPPTVAPPIPHATRAPTTASHLYTATPAEQGTSR